MTALTPAAALHLAEDAGFADDWARALRVVLHPAEHGTTAKAAGAAWRRGRARGLETPAVHYAPRRSTTACGRYVTRQRHPGPLRFKTSLTDVTCPFCLAAATP